MKIEGEALREVLMKSRGRIAAFIWVVVRDARVARDLFQKVVVIAEASCLDFSSEEHLISWALEQSRSEAVRWHDQSPGRSLLHHSLWDALQHDWDSELIGIAEQRLEVLTECVCSLPDDSRELLSLRYTKAMSCGNVADFLNVGLDSVYKSLARIHHGLDDCVSVKISQGFSDETSRESNSI